MKAQNVYIINKTTSKIWQ